MKTGIPGTWFGVCVTTAPTVSSGSVCGADLELVDFEESEGESHTLLQANFRSGRFSIEKGVAETVGVG